MATLRNAVFVLMVILKYQWSSQNSADTGLSALGDKMSVLTTTLDQIKVVKQALEYVGSVGSDNCFEGTGTTLTLSFDHNPWIQFTDPAIRTSNFLSKIIALDGNLERFDDNTFYTLVRNNVHGGSLIFGSAIALEPGVIIRRPKYCPYAFRDNGIISAFDIAVNYDYQQNSTEWYNVAKIMDLSNITVVTDKITLNESDPFNGSYSIAQPVATYLNGHWTYPYFDCGGGDIWMTTYSSPILSVDQNGTVSFQGVSTIDIELTNLDINQCDLTDNEDAKALDVFRGTHSCQPSTTCVPLSEGFRSGAYQCVCNGGFYFPNTTATLKAFSGKEIEAFFESTKSRSPASQFQCLYCPRGCDTCVDATPCLYQIRVAVQAVIVFVIAVMIIGCILISVITCLYKKHLVIKTASPIFLQLMCFGALLMCSSVFVMYGEVTTIACTIQIWLFHLGFMIMYGALLLKTWRISVIFKSGGSAKRVNLPDKALLQRLVPLIAMMAVYLAVWTAINPPRADTVQTSEDLKFFVCTMSWWGYAMFGGEALLLLVGVYLCFTVRKAPAHFNESKFITWATYNAIILGSFILMLTQFVGMSVGPDVMFALMMAQQHVFVTIPMGLIFAPKFWALHKGTSNSSTVYSNQVVTITGRVKQGLAPTSSRFSESIAVSTKSAEVQCNPDDFLQHQRLQAPQTTLKVPNVSNSTSKYSSKVSPVHLDGVAQSKTSDRSSTLSSDA